MPYLMRRLIVDEIQLRETFRIINKYLARFNEGEVTIPNFSHYYENELSEIRLRALYSNQGVVNKAVRVLNQLVEEEDINEYQPQNWVNKNNSSTLERNYCVLAYKCVSVISALDDFCDITENNKVEIKFPICFFRRFFNHLEIDLKFTQQDIQRNCSNEIQVKANHAIHAIITSDIELNKEEFFDVNFFKRFIHMFCNNLLVVPDGKDDQGNIVQPGGEYEFWRLFYFKNAPRFFTLEECRQHFCDELAGT